MVLNYIYGTVMIRYVTLFEHRPENEISLEAVVNQHLNCNNSSYFCSLIEVLEVYIYFYEKCKILYEIYIFQNMFYAKTARKIQAINLNKLCSKFEVNITKNERSARFSLSAVDERCFSLVYSAVIVDLLVNTTNVTFFSGPFKHAKSCL